ncbi:MAG: hypothetical protein V7703_15300 [Hyphomicrobiales bacterium]
MKIRLVVLSVLLSLGSSIADAQPKLPQAWIEAISEISGSFESGGANKNQKFSAVTGDFDCQGLSLGYLNWPLGTGSFFELLEDVDESEIEAISEEVMPTYGDEWAEMISLGRDGEIAKAVSQSRDWQTPAYSAGACNDDKRNGIKFSDKVLAKEIKAFLLHDTVRDAQIDGLRAIADEAFAKAVKWAKLQRGPDAAPQFNEFAVFFDLRTQNGLKYADSLMALVSETNESYRWKRTYNRAATSWIQISWDQVHPKHVEDGKQNAKHWRKAFDRGEVSTSDNQLLLLIAMRGMLAKQPYTTDTMNRKGVMAVGFGWAHTHFFDHRSTYKKMDAIFHSHAMNGS